MLWEYPDISRSDIVRSEHFQVDYIPRSGRSPVGHFPVGTFPGRDTSRSEHFLFPVGTLPGRPESVLQKISTFAKRQFKRQRNIHFEHNCKRRLQWVGLGAWENPRGSLEHPRNYLMSARLGSVRLGQVRLGCCDFPGEIQGESLKRPRNSLMFNFFGSAPFFMCARSYRLGSFRLGQVGLGCRGFPGEFTGNPQNVLDTVKYLFIFGGHLILIYEYKSALFRVSNRFIRTIYPKNVINV